MKVILNNKSAQKAEKIKEMLLLYSEWQDWFDSNYCFFNEKEKQTIEYVNENRDIYDIAFFLKLSVTRVRQIQSRVLRKLHWGNRNYKEWQEYRQLDDIKLKKLHRKHSKFLNASLLNIDINPKLQKALINLGCKNLKQALKYSKAELLTKEGIGRKRLYELEELLKEQGCYFLLKH